LQSSVLFFEKILTSVLLKYWYISYLSAFYVTKRIAVVRPTQLFKEIY